MPMHAQTAANGWSAWKTSIRRAKCRGRQAISCTRLRHSDSSGTEKSPIRATVTPCMKKPYAVCKPPDWSIPAIAAAKTGRPGQGGAQTDSSITDVAATPANALHRKANSRRGASASPTALSVFQTASSAVTPKTSPATSAISSCFVQTVTGHTNSPSLPTMPNRALPTSSADKTCSFPLRAKSICSSVWAFRHRNMPTCRC